MGAIRILADSCCDLSPELIREYDIHVIPLYVVLGEKVYQDGVDVNCQMLYDYFDATAQTPKTTAANVGNYEDYFRPFVEAGDELIYLGLSAQMSSTLSNARMAAGLFPDAKIACIDSKNLSTGIGLIVLRAAEMVREGLGFDEIVANVEQLVDLSRASFILEKLEYLRRGGRCSLLASMGASMLSIKPEIAVRNGAMSNRSKFRGSMLSCAEKYVQSLLATPDRIDKRRAFVTYTPGTDEQLVETVYNTAKAANLFDEILRTEAGSVVTSHCGRNTIGLLFLDKPE